MTLMVETVGCGKRSVRNYSLSQPWENEAITGFCFAAQQCGSLCALMKN
jgi:hypothetical protein